MNHDHLSSIKGNWTISPGSFIVKISQVFFLFNVIPSNGNDLLHGLEELSDIRRLPTDMFECCPGSALHSKQGAFYGCL
jgi:hypothetical protein